MVEDDPVTTDSVFGQMPDGSDVRVLTIGSEPGPVVEILTLGATIHRLLVAGGDGVRRNVVLGHPDVAGRLASSDYIGGTIGRYANRIAGGRFPLGDRTVEVRTHDRGNSLHGGPEGFDVRRWDAVSHTADEVWLTLVSPDGDQGFPGTVTATVRYRVSGDTVSVEMTATTDAPTVVGMTNHAYWNLDGEDAGTIDDHLLAIDADDYTPVDDTGIPLGAHQPVAGTPFDLPAPTPLGVQLDHNFVVRGDGLRRHASLASPRTATTVEVWSDQPGLQVYTGDMLDGPRHHRRAGVALEPQVFPDSPNQPEWPSPVLAPGDTYRSTIEWRFSS
jgi:galactose mutarotase-like enzyme